MGRPRLKSSRGELIKAAPVSTGRAAVLGKFSFPSPDQFLFHSRPSARTQREVHRADRRGGATWYIAANQKPRRGYARPVDPDHIPDGNPGSQCDAALTAPLPWNDPRVQPWMRPQLDPSEIKVIHARSSAMTSRRLSSWFFRRRSIRPASITRHRHFGGSFGQRSAGGRAHGLRSSVDRSGRWQQNHRNNLGVDLMKKQVFSLFETQSGLMLLLFAGMIIFAV